MTSVALAGRLQLRTGWLRMLLWVVGVAAMMGLTVISISRLYDTQAKIDSYAAAVSTGDALRVINGRVYGLDTLGGVIQNEFGFVASIAFPLMGILLTAWGTRREEESGRAELVLAGRIRRTAPLPATLLSVTAALVATGVLITAALASVGLPLGPAVLYAASLVLLGLVFAGVTGLLAQLLPDARSVQATAFLILVAAYLLRGIGDVGAHGLVWLSPLGWAEESRAFGAEPRWWPLLLPLAGAVIASGAAWAVCARRDLGAAVVARRRTRPRASAWLCTPVGVALSTHRGSLTIWTLVAAALGGTYGSLAQQVLDAMEGNPDLATMMGGGGSGLDALLGMTVLMIALCASAFAVQAVRTVGTEEAAGRVEPLLAAGWPRERWLAAHGVVIAGGVVLVSVAGWACIGAGIWTSMGDAGLLPRLARAQAAYLPAVLLVAAISVALHGIRQRAALLGWLLLAFCVVVALLGQALQLPAWVQNLSPLTHVGRPPVEFPGTTTIVALSILTALVASGGAMAWGRRDIPG